MSDLIARAEAALEGVTEGVWDVRDGFVYPLSIRCTLGGIREQDAHFIAAARELVPELIAELKAARAELVELGSIFDALVDKSRQTHEELKAAAEMERLRAGLTDYTRALAAGVLAAVDAAERETK